MNETRILADFVQRTRYEDLPTEIIHQAKLCLLDLFGVALFGSRTEWGKMVTELAREAGGHPEASVWAGGFQTSAASASLTNGTMGHGFELDDIYYGGGIHPGTVVIPAMLAMGERQRADGRSALAAVVLGYEAMGRVGATARHMIQWGMHPTGCNGVFGAAAAAGKMLGLNAGQVLNAFGIAASMASGISEFSQDPEGTMVKRLHGGWPAHGGITAALLAAKGFTGPSTALEGKYGYCRVFSGTEGPDLPRLTVDLGQDFVISHRWVKPYACCGRIHATMDAVLEFKKQYNVAPQEIERVIVGVGNKALEQNSTRGPKSIMAAQYSIPYTTALALVEDLRNPGVYTDNALRDATVAALSDRVDVVLDPEIARNDDETSGARLTIKLMGGREFQQVVYASKGTPQQPMTDEEIREKFRRLAGTVSPERQVAQIEALVDGLERVSDLGELGALLRQPKS